MGTPRPPLAIAAACTDDADCASGHCTDGVCCNAECIGPCVRCDLTTIVGTCASVPSGRPPRPGACPVEVALTCGNDGTCDGVGRCRLRLENTPCGDGFCDGDTVVGASVCDGKGACRVGARRICTPYTCDPATAQCRDHCVIDADCAGKPCQPGGRCGFGPEQTCRLPDECASGFCVSGVCCDSACDGPCMACDVPGRSGTCSPRVDCAVDAGTD